MRGIPCVLIVLAACTDPDLGAVEQQLAPTCDSYTICNSTIVDDCYRWAGSAPCAAGETPCTDPIDGGMCLSYVPHVVAPTSCEGRCGGVAPAGCSCDEDCSWYGTCCSDIATRCPGSGDGQAFVNVVMPREASQSGAAVKGELRTDSKFIAMNDPAAIGLTKVDFGVTNDQGEHSQCRVTDTLSDGSKFGCTSASGACYVEASVDYDDNRATCAAGGLRFPAGWGSVQSGAVSVRVGCQSGCSGSGSGGTLAWDGVNYTESVCMGGSATASIPFFTQVKIEDVDAGNEHPGCWFEFYGGTCGWRLRARAEDDADIWCSAALLNYSNGMANQLLDDGTEETSLAVFMNNTQDNTGSVQVNGVSTPQNAWRYTAQHASDGGYYRNRVERSLAWEESSFCFLSKVQFQDIDDSTERAGCEIVSKNGKWTLIADVHGWDNDLDADVWCNARCVSLPTTAGKTSWPGIPTLVVDTRGAKAHLFQSGAYDLPVLFFEGFDPTNKLAPAHYMKEAAPLFRQMQALGFDIWVVDQANGGQDVRTDAQQFAAAVDMAYKFQSWNTNHPGKKLPVIGVSMGALAGRVALATWETGAYNTGGSENIGLTTAAPPVNTFIALVGPQYGANIPKAMQAVVQDIGDYHDIGESRIALNTPAAVNMLNERIDPQCDALVSQWCDAGALQFFGTLLGSHGDYTLKDMDVIGIYGDQTGLVAGCGVDTSGCLARAGAGPSTCLSSATPSPYFYGDVNQRGLRGNGFPNSVFTVGMATSSWKVQGSANMPAGYSQITETPFTTSTKLAQGELNDSGHGPFQLYCQRNARVDLFLGANDLAPGDLSARNFDDLAIDPGPRSDAWIKQYFPFVHIPTGSALACPASSSQAACEAENRAYGRFSRIHSLEPSLNLNDQHGHVDSMMAAWILAYMWDGGVGDGDGFIGTSNPFYQPFMASALDCNDASASIHPGAQELCNGIDDDCDGLVDEDYHVGQACDGPDTDLCNEGWIACTSPTTAACNDNTNNNAEKCGDGIDNDCNGQVDEGCTKPTSGGGTCFAAGTPVAMADGTRRAIEDVHVGDKVMSYDEGTGLVVASSVVVTFVHPDVGDLILINGIAVTPEHAFFVRGEWRRADQIQLGDTLFRLPAQAEQAGHVYALPVTSLASLPGRQTVYNFEVEHQHTYFVDGILVHNRKQDVTTVSP